MTRQRFRLIILAGIVCVFAFAGLGILAYQHRTQFTATITTQAAPSDATITINGASVKAGQSDVKPGTYKVAISRSGFVSYTQTVTVAKGQNQFVGASLEPNSSATDNWYQTHPSDAKAIEGISSKNYDAIASTQQRELPLIINLPYSDQEFYVDYGPSQAHPDDPYAVALYITYWSQDGKQKAIDWLKFMGYDPSKLEIIYQAANYDF